MKTKIKNQIWKMCFRYQVNLINLYISLYNATGFMPFIQYAHTLSERFKVG
jgi:hypothetical protein